MADVCDRDYAGSDGDDNNDGDNRTDNAGSTDSGHDPGGASAGLADIGGAYEWARGGAGTALICSAMLR